MTWKIFRSILFTSLMILFSALLVFTGILHAYFSDIQEDELRDELNLAAAAVESIGLDYLEKLSSDRYRLTWVESSGNVLYDTHSQTSAETMDNHAEREEIKEAFATGFGSSSRYSTTLTEETLYEAKKLTDGTVLRISTSYSTTGALLLGLLQPTCFITLIAAVLSGVLADKMSRRIVEPLNKLNLEKPLENEAYEELAPLLNRIHSLHNKIDHQMNTLKHRKEEFDHITENMQEGLVLLDAEDRILSINPAAMKLFSADRHCIGSDFLQIDRHTDLIQAIRQAQTQGHNEILLSRGAHTYQCDYQVLGISPVQQPSDSCRQSGPFEHIRMPGQFLRHARHYEYQQPKPRLFLSQQPDEASKQRQQRENHNDDIVLAECQFGPEPEFDHCKQCDDYQRSGQVYHPRLHLSPLRNAPQCEEQANPDSESGQYLQWLFVGEDGIGIAEHESEGCEDYPTLDYV